MNQKRERYAIVWERVFLDPDLCCSERMVLAALSFHARRRAGAVVCHPKLKTLAAETGLTEETVREKLGKLQGRYFDREARFEKGGRRTSDLFILKIRTGRGGISGVGVGVKKPTTRTRQEGTEEDSGSLPAPKESATLKPYFDAWEHHFGTKPGPKSGLLARVLWPLHKEYGMGKVLPSLANYLDVTEPRYLDLQKWASTWPAYLPGARPSRGGPRTAAEKSMDAMHKVLRETEEQ